jgi:hypothetical protein
MTFSNEKADLAFSIQNAASKETDGLQMVGARKVLGTAGGRGD